MSAAHNLDLSSVYCLLCWLIVSPQGLTAADRSGLIDDAFALARYRIVSLVMSNSVSTLFCFPHLSSSPYPKIDIDIPLKLVQSLVNETSYVPWSTAVSWLRAIGTQLQYSPVFGEFKVCMSVTIQHSNNRHSIMWLIFIFRNKFYK